MGERKVLNRYFPPDFDPLLVPRRKWDPYKQVEVRMMIPFSLQCVKCGEYMYRGARRRPTTRLRLLPREGRVSVRGAERQRPIPRELRRVRGAGGSARAVVAGTSSRLVSGGGRRRLRATLLRRNSPERAAESVSESIRASELPPRLKREDPRVAHPKKTLGKKFNSRKEDVVGDTYLGIRKYRFYIKCCVCSNEIAFKTDPQNQDYVCESGATRNFESWRQQDDKEKEFEDEQKESNEQRGAAWHS
jgi:hypothetical protein